MREPPAQLADGFRRRQLVPLATQHNRLGVHPVLGQRPGLVGADHGGRAQGLHGRQMSDQYIPLGHPLGSDGQRQRDRRQQSFGHVRHDDPNREDEIGPEGQAEHQPDDEEHAPQHDREHRDDPADKRDLTLKGKRQFAGGLGQVGNLAKLGLHARGEDNRAGVAGDDCRARQDNIGAV